jgi:hypothetical protein
MPQLHGTRNMRSVDLGFFSFDLELGFAEARDARDFTFRLPITTLPPRPADASFSDWLAELSCAGAASWE